MVRGFTAKKMTAGSLAAVALQKMFQLRNGRWMRPPVP
jgi:hypothetical protein